MTITYITDSDGLAYKITVDDDGTVYKELSDLNYLHIKLGNAAPAPKSVPSSPDILDIFLIDNIFS